MLSIAISKSSNKVEDTLLNQSQILKLHTMIVSNCAHSYSEGRQKNWKYQSHKIVHQFLSFQIAPMPKGQENWPPEANIFAINL